MSVSQKFKSDAHIHARREYEFVSIFCLFYSFFRKKLDYKMQSKEIKIFSLKLNGKRKQIILLKKILLEIGSRILSVDKKQTLFKDVKSLHNYLLPKINNMKPNFLLVKKHLNRLDKRWQIV